MEKTESLLLSGSLTEADCARIIEMAWEDRTAYEAIEAQFGLNQHQVVCLMRKQLKWRSFKLWRQRTAGRVTKHLSLRNKAVSRHQSRQHNKLHRKFNY